MDTVLLTLGTATMVRRWLVRGQDKLTSTTVDLDPEQLTARLQRLMLQRELRTSGVAVRFFALAPLPPSAGPRTTSHTHIHTWQWRLMLATAQLVRARAHHGIAPGHAALAGYVWRLAQVCQPPVQQTLRRECPQGSIAHAAHD